MKNSIVTCFLFFVAFFGFSNTVLGQNEGPLVKIYLKNHSLLPKGVGLKITRPMQAPDISFYGTWMPFAKKMLALPVGTKVEFISDKAVVMSGNAASHSGKLVAEVKAEDSDRIFSF
jgi:hypothetical protein